MLGLFQGIKDHIPLSGKLHSPLTEGVCNRLHFRATVTLLFGCCLLVSCIEWIGNDRKISCIMEGPDDDWHISDRIIETYCYIVTTFTVPKHLSSKIGHVTAHVGVGAYNPHEDEVSHKAYYQWVPFVLFLQGLMFYLPHVIFKSWEGGKVKSIMSGLNQLILNKNERREKQKILANYVAESMNTHNFWALKMVFIELINLINVVGNIYFVDVFLGGEFSTYGMEVINFLDDDPDTRIDPMARVFPKVTKCSYYQYGPSGTVETLDSICVLPLNSINEKIYVFLWFWFLILSIITVFSMLYHIFTMVSPGITKMTLSSRTMNQHNIHLDEIGKRCEMGDWKLLSLLSLNMEPMVFGEFLKELYHILNSDKNAANGNVVHESNGKSDRKSSVRPTSPPLEDVSPGTPQKFMYVV